MADSSCYTANLLHPPFGSCWIDSFYYFVSFAFASVFVFLYFGSFFFIKIIILLFNPNNALWMRNPSKLTYIWHCVIPSKSVPFNDPCFGSSMLLSILNQRQAAGALSGHSSFSVHASLANPECQTQIPNTPLLRWLLVGMQREHPTKS